ncbi:hypothetical protein F4778DRAFT_255621 [Xylariomycetidae sp. FL2044]|nr:hypothetical protein F4778DRAFT_255621 [Xylariomycetidae sp. FL2044]
MAADKISLPIMEEKRSLRSRSRRRHRSVILLTLIALVLYSFSYFQPVSSYAGQLVSCSHDNPPATEASAIEASATPEQQHQQQHQQQHALTTNSLVPLEAHIMSKCPDATYCLKEMVLPAMVRVYEKVNFTLSYIGTPTENDGVDCKHGPDECMGNILELCAAHLYPDPKIYLGFTMCLAKDYKHIPQRDLVEDCALEHAIDFSKLNECATRDNGAFGTALLRNSVQRTAKVSLAAKKERKKQ